TDVDVAMARPVDLGTTTSFTGPPDLRLVVSALGASAMHTPNGSKRYFTQALRPAAVLGPLTCSRAMRVIVRTVGERSYGGNVRVATWNVNSVKQRVPR